MSFRHLTPGQNRETAGLLVSIAKGLGVAVTLALLVGGPQFNAIEWLAGAVLAVLFGVLGIRMIGDVEKLESRRPGKTRRGRRN